MPKRLVRKKLVPVESEIAMLTLRRNELQKAQEGKKDEEIPTAEKDELNDVEKKIEAQKTEKENILNGYATGNKVVHQPYRPGLVAKQHAEG